MSDDLGAAEETLSLSLSLRAASGSHGISLVPRLHAAPEADLAFSQRSLVSKIARARLDLPSLAARTDFVSETAEPISNRDVTIFVDRAIRKDVERPRKMSERRWPVR